jgi:hypothetical protein
VSLSAFAAVTRNIRLSMGILIAPLRPAVLLAKQLATLDVMSRGRVDVGLGMGWQKEEYEAAGVPWETRYKQFDEQIEVCKLLWSHAPADYRGQDRQFRKDPRLSAPGAADDSDVVRAGADGEEFRPHRQIRHRLDSDGAQAGGDRRPCRNDARGLRCRRPRPEGDRNPRRRPPERLRPGKDRPDLDETFATIPALIEAGATTLEFIPSVWCKTPDELPAFFKRLTAWRDSTK